MDRIEYDNSANFLEKMIGQWALKINNYLLYEKIKIHQEQRPLGLGLHE
jgi:hypothetical protein